ncbi:MAG: ParB/RepB/Spo0J family partition protein [Fidelibacterota bacterium]
MTAKRLGRGLSALIRETTDETVTPEGVLYIPLELVSPNPFQPRQDLESEAARKSLEELATSIRERGMIQPVTVRAKDDRYELIVGERRWRAARSLGLTEIPAHVIQVDDDVEMMEYALVENLQREDLNVLDEARAYATLTSEYGLTQAEIAKAVGKSRVAVSNTLRLLRLPGEIKESLRQDRITPGHARALLGLKKQGDVKRLWRKIVDQGLSVRDTERLVNEWTSSPKQTGKGPARLRTPKPADIRKIENDLIGILGTRVTIRVRRNGGVIEVAYYSDEDLQRLVELWSEIET